MNIVLREVRSIIQFLWVVGGTNTEIHKQIERNKQENVHVTRNVGEEGKIICGGKNRYS